MRIAENAATELQNHGSVARDQDGERGLGEFILPYEDLRTSASPDETLLAFLETTYDAAADLAHWDRKALERPTV